MASNIETKDPLDLQCSDEHLLHIAATFDFDWQVVGVRLLLDHQTIEDIDREKKNEQGKRDALFHKWKQMKGSDATYRELVNVLECIKYRKAAEAVKSLVLQVHQVAEEESKSAPSATKEKKFPWRCVECGCGKCDLKKILEKGCANSTQFPYLHAVQGLTDGEQQFLFKKLAERTEAIRLSLGHLKGRCSRWLSKHLSLHQFKEVLNNVDGAKGTKMLEQNRMELNAANTHGQLMQIIYRHVSWYNYQLLQHVMQLCTEEINGQDEAAAVQDMFKSYEEELMEYYKQRVFECPPPSNAKLSTDSKYFVLKIDAEFKELTLGHLHDHFQHDLQTILNIYPHALHFRLAQEGCTELVYIIPKCVHKVVFPLCNEQWEKLVKLGVIELSTEGFCLSREKNVDVTSPSYIHQQSTEAAVVVLLAVISVAMVMSSSWYCYISGTTNWTVTPQGLTTDLSSRLAICSLKESLTTGVPIIQLKSCPNAPVTLDCATSNSLDPTFITVQVNGMGGHKVTMSNSDHNSTENLPLPDGTNATVQCYITTETILLHVSFTATPDLNRTSLRCYPGDGTKQMNRTVIVIEGPPLVAPVNLTFNPSTTTLTWEEAPQQRNISYVCTATYPNGHVNTTNVTNGTTMVLYDLEDLNIPGKITFMVQPVNCGAVGPNATVYTDWPYRPQELAINPSSSLANSNKETTSLMEALGSCIAAIGLAVVIVLIFVCIWLKKRRPVNDLEAAANGDWPDMNGDGPDMNGDGPDMNVSGAGLVHDKDIQATAGSGPRPDGDSKKVVHVTSDGGDEAGSSDDTEKDGVVHTTQHKEGLDLRQRKGFQQ